MSDTFDRSRWVEQEFETDEPVAAEPEPGEESLPEAVAADDEDDIERSSENVLESWPEPAADVHSTEDALAAAEEHAEPAEEHAEPEEDAAEPDEQIGAPTALRPAEREVEDGQTSSEHAPGELVVPPGYPVLEGMPRGERRAVGVVVGRFNGEVTTRLLAGALDELEACGVAAEAVTVMPVPGAFELPLAAMALAKTRRFACIVALGCVIRGDTPHFDYVAS